MPAKDASTITAIHTNFHALKYCQVIYVVSSSGEDGNTPSPGMDTLGKLGIKRSLRFRISYWVHRIIEVICSQLMRFYSKINSI
jgi:hypothetical protein